MTANISAPPRKTEPPCEGCANIPAIIKKLREIGYDGPFTIEREISGEQQEKDIAKARELILEWIAAAEA